MRPLHAFFSFRALLGIGLLLLAAGCAPKSPKLKAPIEPKRSEIALPGAGRELPSTQNRRTAPRDAPTAFALPGDSSDSMDSFGTDVPDRRGDADYRRGEDERVWRTDEGRTSDGADVSTSRGHESKESSGRSSASSETSERQENRTVRPVTPRSTPVPTPLEEARPQPGESYYSVQLLVVSASETANSWQAEASRRLGESVRVDREDGLYKVRIGKTTREGVAEEIRRQAILEGFEDAFLVRLEATR